MLLSLCFSLLLCSSARSLPPLCAFSTDRTSLVHHSQVSKDVAPSLGAPPPLISPKGPHHPPPPPPPPTTLWNPAALVDTTADSRRKLNPPTPPSRPPPGLTRSERAPLSWGEKLDDGGRGGGQEVPERLTSLQSAAAPLDRGPWSRAEQDRAAQGLHHWQHGSSSMHHRANVTSDPATSSPAQLKELPTQPPATMLVYDEVLQQHRRLLSKLDLEEKKRKEAREEGESRLDSVPPVEGALCNGRWCPLLRLLLRPGRVVRRER